MCDRIRQVQAQILAACDVGDTAKIFELVALLNGVKQASGGVRCASQGK